MCSTTSPVIFGEVLNAAVAGGKYGVNLFFALSSYLITDLLIREREQFGSLDVRFFYLRRILRIWPLYYFILLISVLIPLFDPNHEFGLRYLLPFMFLSGNWAFVAFGGLTSVAASPLWSVSVEEQFYLLWPPVVARLSRRQIIYAALGMILVANFTRVMLLVSSASPMALWANTFAHLDSIAAGILLAIVLHGRAPSIRLTTRIALLICGSAGITVRGYFQTVSADSMSWGTTLFGWPAVAASLRCNSLCLYRAENTTAMASVFGQNLLRALRLSYVLYYDGRPIARDSASHSSTHFSSRCPERMFSRSVLRLSSLLFLMPRWKNPS